MSSTASLVGYFYFDFNDVDKQLSSKLLRSLLLQVSLHAPGGLNALRQLYEDCQNGQSQPQDDTLQPLLDQVIAGTKQSYIVIDALDECRDHDELLGLIDDLVNKHNDVLHLLTTSRCERDIEELLALVVTYRINIQNAVVDHDIRLYVQDRLHNDSKLKKWPET